MEYVPHDGFSMHAKNALDQLTDNMGELAIENHAPHELMFLYDVAFGRWNNNMHVDGHIIQSGVHRGATLSILGLAAEQNKSPFLVYGLDPYRNPKEDDGWKYNQEENYLYVRDIVEKMNLNDRVCVCCFDSANYCKRLPSAFPVRMIFIDSNHTVPQINAELAYMESLLNSGGWLVFHDVFHTKLPEFSNAIETWILNNQDRYVRWLRLRKYPREGHEHSWVPMSIVACRKK